jgi:hypothetical protein
MQLKFWYFQGRRVTKAIELLENEKWEMIKRDIEVIGEIKNPTQDMKDYVTKHRPDLALQLHFISESPVMVEQVA